MRRFLLTLGILLLAALACGESQSIPPPPENSIFDSGKTAYGFFPSPPEVSIESVFQLYKDINLHGDFVLIQQNTAWEDFVEDGLEGESQTRTDLINHVKLARQNDLETVFVIDALNGLNHCEFIGLPAGWEASFRNPDVRAAYRNYALWVVRTFHPRYLGLASEINTYMDTHPDDAGNFTSLYHEMYALLKAEAPETQIFVSFQLDDLNNMFPQPEEGTVSASVPTGSRSKPSNPIWIFGPSPRIRTSSSPPAQPSPRTTTLRFSNGPKSRLPLPKADSTPHSLQIRARLPYRPGGVPRRCPYPTRTAPRLLGQHFARRLQSGFLCRRNEETGPRPAGRAVPRCICPHWSS